MPDDLLEGMDKHFEAAGIAAEETQTTSASSETTSGTDTQGGTSTQSAPSTPDKIEGEAGKDSLGGKVDSAKKPGTKEDGKGTNPTDDLKPGDIKLTDGTVVRAGAERRHFENARMYRAESIDLKNQLNTSNQKFQTLEGRYNELKSTVAQIGVEDPAQLSSAVRLYKDLARDPKGTVTKLLAELKGMGHTFDGIGGQIDTAAIQQMLDRKLQTSENTGQQQQSPQEADAEIAREVQSFVQQFPECTRSRTADC
jgi:hypothetical protein